MKSYTESDFEYPEGFQLTSSNSSCSSSSPGGLFNSSFNSIASLFNECYTPPRYGSSGVIDMDDLSLCQPFLGSNGSNSPLDDAMFYPMPDMSSNVMSEILDFNPFSMSSCKSNSGYDMTFGQNPSQVTNAYEPYALGACSKSSPDMSFNSLPGLLFENSASPLLMGSSPSDFVAPLQTSLLEPFRPTTPAQDLSKTLLASPLAKFSQPLTTIRHFMSPRGTQTQTPRSNISFKSDSTSPRSPSSHALECSAALHRVQSLGASRNRKDSKRPQVKTKIGHVPAGVFHCDFKGCKSERKGFKRQEHLKHHQRTHIANRLFKCQFCDKPIQLDRADNYKSHVLLHTIPKEIKRGTRTKYFPEAIDFYASLCTKKRSSADKPDSSDDKSSIITRKGRSSRKNSNGAQ